MTARVTLPRAVLRLVAVALAVGCVGLAGGASAGGCGGDHSEGEGRGLPVVLADTTFLADIVRNVAGDRLSVSSIVPEGIDPHSFEPTPRDAAGLAKADAVVINSPGLEPRIDELIAGLGDEAPAVIDASAGVSGRDLDPHVWLDPLAVITYVDNIESGLASLRPDGTAAFKANAEAYRGALRDLDAWIRGEVGTIPAEDRLLVTNHESFSRFAERYGFTIVGSVLPGQGTEGAPSAEGLASLIQAIQESGAPAIFVETGSLTDLSQQVARETGVEVVTDLYTHSLGEGARSYLEMMRWNVRRIVDALR